MRTVERWWPEAEEHPPAQGPIPAATQVRGLKLVFWMLLVPLLIDFALAPSFKIGAAIAGILAVAAWIRSDLKKISERV